MATPERIEELKINLETLREEFTPGNCNLTLHDDLSASYSDLYKSINGFRPRWVDTREMSELEILIMMDDLVREEELQREWEAEEIRKEEEAKERAMSEGVGDEAEPEWKRKLSSMRSMMG
jgi:hypothetical protein